jgi:hypothetical protein
MRRRGSAKLMVCGLGRERVEGKMGIEKVKEGVCHREMRVGR